MADGCVNITSNVTQKRCALRSWESKLGPKQLQLLGVAGVSAPQGQPQQQQQQQQRVMQQQPQQIKLSPIMPLVCLCSLFAFKSRRTAA